MIDSSSAIAKVMNTTRRLQEVMYSSGVLEQSINSARRLQEMMNSSGAIEQSVNSARRLQEVMNSSGAIERSINSARRFQEVMNSSGAIAQTINSARRLQEVINSNGALAKALNSTSKFQELVRSNSAITEIINSSLVVPSVFNESVVRLAKPENLASAVSLIEQKLAEQDYKTLITGNDTNEEIVNASLDAIFENKNSESFGTIFSRIPFVVQIVLVFMFMQIILPQLNSISANLMTPYLDEFISDMSDKDKVRTLKKIDFNELDVPFKNMRFISGNSVRLRENPNIKSDVIDMLLLGQVVVFLEKNKNWTNVMIQYDDKEVVSGWVFTRYVEKFRTKN